MYIFVFYHEWGRVSGKLLIKFTRTTHKETNPTAPAHRNEVALDGPNLLINDS